MRDEKVHWKTLKAFPAFPLAQSRVSGMRVVDGKIFIENSSSMKHVNIEGTRKVKCSENDDKKLRRAYIVGPEFVSNGMLTMKKINKYPWRKLLSFYSRRSNVAH